MNEQHEKIVETTPDHGHDQKIKELVGKVRQQLGITIIANPANKVDQYLSEIEHLETTFISAAEQKLWAELGISDQPSQQKLMRELARLSNLFKAEQKINLVYGSEPAPPGTIKRPGGNASQKR
ncbi:MAG: hypothetical protein NY202_03050 [Mollicutes bacterium UO1]